MFALQKYATVLTDDGSPLTSYHKHLLALARALIRNPRILLWEEDLSIMNDSARNVLTSYLDKVWVQGTAKPTHLETDLLFYWHIFTGASRSNHSHFDESRLRSSYCWRHYCSPQWWNHRAGKARGAHDVSRGIQILSYTAGYLFYIWRAFLNLPVSEFAVLLQTETKKNRIIFFGSTKMVHLSSHISYQITSFLVILELQELLKTILVWKLCAFLFLSVSLYGFSFFIFIIYHLNCPVYYKPIIP